MERIKPRVGRQREQPDRRWFARAGHLDPVDARDMAGWDHGVRCAMIFRT
jgi:hypothetical protein